MVGTKTAAQAAPAGQPTSEIIVNGSEFVHRFPGKFRVANWFDRPFLNLKRGMSRACILRLAGDTKEKKNEAGCGLLLRADGERKTCSFST